MNHLLSRSTVLLAASAVAGTAHAHSGHDHGAFAGLLHPLMGIDHLLAIVAVGLWIGCLGKPAGRLLPLCFLAVMGFAAAAGLIGLGLPAVELGIAGSVLLAGLLLALRVHVSPAVGASVVGVFALFHGYAHGAELPATAIAWQYFAGFMFTTAGLLMAGNAIGQRLRRAAGVLPAAGAAVAAAGGWMIASLA